MLNSKVLVVVLSSILVSSLALARENNGAGGIQGKGSQTSGGALGLGLSLGGPTGLTGKYYLSDSSGLSFGLGFGGHGWLGAHLDYVISVANFGLNEAGSLYPYIGGGVGLGFFGGLGYGFGPVYSHFPLWADVHFTGGLGWNVATLPLDVFLEVAPGLAILPGLGLGWHGILGFRYYF